MSAFGCDCGGSCGGCASQIPSSNDPRYTRWFDAAISTKRNVTTRSGIFGALDVRSAMAAAKGAGNGSLVQAPVTRPAPPLDYVPGATRVNVASAQGASISSGGFWRAVPWWGWALGAGAVLAAVGTTAALSRRSKRAA